ncbi:MAG: hypothetical protein LQ347_002901, partial [Umbilicaria vellea]
EHYPANTSLPLSPISSTQRNIIPIRRQPVPIPTNRSIIALTNHATLRLLRGIDRTRNEGVGSPALATVFQADPFVVVGEREAVGDCHVVGGGYEFGQSAAVGDFDEAVVVGEVCVAGDDCRGGGAGAGAGAGGGGGGPVGVGVELVDVRLGLLEVEVVEVDDIGIDETEFEETEVDETEVDDTEVDDTEIRVETVVVVFAEVESAVERLEVVLAEGEVAADTVVLFTEEVVPVDVEVMVAVLKVVVVVVVAATVEVEVDVLVREYN